MFAPLKVVFVVYVSLVESSWFHFFCRLNQFLFIRGVQNSLSELSPTMHLNNYWKYTYLLLIQSIVMPCFIVGHPLQDWLPPVLFVLGDILRFNTFSPRSPRFWPQFTAVTFTLYITFEPYLTFIYSNKLVLTMYHASTLLVLRCQGKPGY